jgi:hypothetical protein
MAVCFTEKDDGATRLQVLIRRILKGVRCFGAGGSIFKKNFFAVVGFFGWVKPAFFNPGGKGGSTEPPVSCLIPQLVGFPGHTGFDQTGLI